MALEIFRPYSTTQDNPELVNPSIKQRAEMLAALNSQNAVLTSKKKINIPSIISAFNPFKKNPAVEAIKKDVGTTYPLTPQGSALTQNANIRDVSPQVEPALGLVRPAKDALEPNTVGANRRVLTGEDRLRIADNKAETAFHEILHTEFNNLVFPKSRKDDEGSIKDATIFAKYFNDEWSKVAQRSPLMKGIDTDVYTLYPEAKTSGFSLAAERYARLGEALGQEGLSAIPKKLQPFYSGVIAKEKQIKDNNQYPITQLAAVIYGEAAGSKDKTKGMTGVANTIFNRTKEKLGSTTLSSLLSTALSKAQYSAVGGQLYNKAVSGKITNPVEKAAWDKAQEIATKLINNQLKDITGGATHYYNPTIVTPNWSKEGVNTANIEGHVFKKGIKYGTPLLIASPISPISLKKALVAKNK